MPPGERAGFELPLLLVGAFRSLIDELHRALSENGHVEARPLHGFALQAIGPHGCTASELGRRLGVSKQVISRFEEGDYQTVAVAKLQNILDAIGIKMLVTIDA